MKPWRDWFGHERMLERLEPLVYRWRGTALTALLALSGLLVLCALALRFDGGHGRWQAQDHPWMQALEEYEDEFGGDNALHVAVIQEAPGDIYNETFLARLRQVTETVRSLPGVQRVSSLFTPDVRHVEIVEGSAVGESVIPAEFRPTPFFLDQVRSNVERSGLVGRYTTPDQRGALVYAQLAETDPDTDARLDHRDLAKRLDEQLRARFDDAHASIHVTGHAVLAADLRRALPGVLAWFALSVVIVTAVLAFALGHWRTALAPVACALLALAWNVGLAALWGVHVDLHGLLVPLLAFLLALILGVVQADAWLEALVSGRNGFDASLDTFRRLALPTAAGLGGVWLASFALRAVPVAAVHDMARNAALAAFAVLVATQLLLPLWLSYAGVGDAERLVKSRLRRRERLRSAIDVLARVGRPVPAAAIVLAAAVLTGWAGWRTELLANGTPDARAPELRSHSRYNQDVAAIAKAFPAGPERIDVLAEADPESCVDHDAMEQIDRLAWHLSQEPAVREVQSLPGQARELAVALADGNPRFTALPRNRYNLVQAITPIPSSSGLYSANCSAMTVRVYTQDRAAATLASLAGRVARFDDENARAWHELHKETDSRYCARKLAARRALGRQTLELKRHVEALRARGKSAAEADADSDTVELKARSEKAAQALQEFAKPCPVTFRMGSGPLVPVAAAQDVVARSEFEVLGWTLAALLLAASLALRGVAQALCAVLPALVACALTYAIMAILQVPMTLGLLALVPLLAGIGVVMSMLIQAPLTAALAAGRAPEDAVREGAHGEGRALLVAVVAAGLALLPWLASGVQLQVDVGALVASGLLLQALMAVALGPALGRFLLDAS